MNKSAIFYTCILMLATSSAGAAAAWDIPQQAMAFNANVMVAVDATGKAIRVETLDELPQPLREYVEQRVASWQYQAAAKDGVAAAALTYVRVGACAIPGEENGGYRLGVDFKGNGPAMVGGNANSLPPPRFPIAMHRDGVGGTFKVSYRIQPDGTTRLEEIKSVDGADDGRIASVRKVLGEWVAGMRYLPEQVNDAPVETEMAFTVSFQTPGSGSPGHTHDELNLRALAARECMVAQRSGRQPLPVDSPVQVMPVPAG